MQIAPWTGLNISTCGRCCRNVGLQILAEAQRRSNPVHHWGRANTPPHWRHARGWCEGSTFQAQWGWRGARVQGAQQGGHRVAARTRRELEGVQGELSAFQSPGNPWRQYQCCAHSWNWGETICYWYFMLPCGALVDAFGCEVLCDLRTSCVSSFINILIL